MEIKAAWSLIVFPLLLFIFFSAVGFPRDVYAFKMTWSHVNLSEVFLLKLFFIHFIWMRLNVLSIDSVLTKLVIHFTSRNIVMIYCFYLITYFPIIFLLLFAFHTFRLPYFLEKFICWNLTWNFKITIKTWTKISILTLYHGVRFWLIAIEGNKMKRKAWFGKTYVPVLLHKGEAF